MTVYVKQQQRQQRSHLQQHVWQVCLMGLTMGAAVLLAGAAR